MRCDTQSRGTTMEMASMLNEQDMSNVGAYCASLKK